MRELIIYNYSMKPEEALGRVKLVGDKITITGFSPMMDAELKKGIPNPKTGERTMPAAGAAFFEGVLNRYSGAYVRAVERKSHG